MADDIAAVDKIVPACLLYMPDTSLCGVAV